MKILETKGKFFVWITLTFVLCQQGRLFAAGFGSSFSDEVVFAGKIFNFLLLFAGLVYLLRKPIMKFFADRRANLKKQLKKAEEARREAIRKLRLMEEKLGKLDEESQSIIKKARENAERERERIINKAKSEAEAIRERAITEIENATRQAKAELKKYASERASEVAEKLIKKEFSAKDDERFFNHFMEKIGEKK